MQEWYILGVGKGVLFREVSSVQECPHRERGSTVTRHCVCFVCVCVYVCDSLSLPLPKGGPPLSYYDGYSAPPPPPPPPGRHQVYYPSQDPHHLGAKNPRGPPPQN